MTTKYPYMDFLLSPAALSSPRNFSMERKFYRQFVPETQDEQTPSALKKDIGMH